MEGSAGISFRLFDETIQKAYAKLFAGDPDKTPEMLHWRFDRNPHGRTKFAVAANGDEVIGMIALVPTRLRNAPGSGIGYQAIDTAVDAAFRGQGLFVKMGSIAQEPAQLGGDILWGFPNANAAPGWYGRLGWTNFGAVPLLMRPLRSSFLMGRLNPKLRSIDVPLIRARRTSAQVYQDGASLSTDFDRLWQKIVSTLGIAVDRSGEWIRWRLIDKPGANYRCVGVKDIHGDVEAFVATKIAEKHGARICYVMEAIGERAAVTPVLSAELARAAHEGAEVALAWCPKTAPNYAAYRKAGFLPIPPRLRPIEINFGAHALLPESAGASASGARWYVSFLDSDTN